MVSCSMTRFWSCNRLVEGSSWEVDAMLVIVAGGACLGKESGNISSASISAAVWGADGYICVMCPVGLHWPVGRGQLEAFSSLKTQFQQPSTVCSGMGWIPAQHEEGRPWRLHSAPLLTLCGQLDPMGNVWVAGDTKLVQRENLSQYLCLQGATPLLVPQLHSSHPGCSPRLPNPPGSEPYSSQAS